jgi:hypothetical protein
MNMQRFLPLILIISCMGCSSMGVNNSTNIATDANGYAVGQYSDSRSGNIYSPSSVVVGGGGGGGGAGGMGLGAAWVGYRTENVQTEGDPLKFARAIAMINYSRRLDKVTAEDASGSKEFTFTTRPTKQKGYQPFGPQVE